MHRERVGRPLSSGRLVCPTRPTAPRPPSSRQQYIEFTLEGARATFTFVVNGPGGGATTTWRRG